MLFTVVFILLLIWVAVVGAIYSNFLVFYSNFEETQNYNKAYYEAISALERAELVIKQHDPGYEWSGWWKNLWESSIEVKIWDSDKSVSDFSYIWKPKTNLFWTIHSLTTRIPATWMWTVDWMFITWDSLNYNAMDYDNSEIALLYYDDSSKEPYDEANIEQTKPTKITWKIRLPGKIQPQFGDLDTAHNLLSGAATNDAIVDWQLKWNYYSSAFTIFARQDVDSTSRKINEQNDSAIRESDLNSWVNLKLSDKSDPIHNKNNTSGFVVVSNNASTIQTQNFEDILKNGDKLELKLSLLNLARNNSGMVYPFLEYYLDFNGKNVPDKFYTINAEWKYWDFQINMLVKKPTIKQSVLWSFTVVF